MTLNTYYILYTALLFFIYILNRKDKNIFFIKLLVITFLTNDFLRILGTESGKGIIFFALKDMFLIAPCFFFLFCYLFAPKKKYILNKNIAYFLFLFILIVIFSYDFSITSKNTLIIASGIYEFLFYPFVVIFLLTSIKLDINKLEKFFLAANISLFLVLVFQVIDSDIYLKYFLNVNIIDRPAEYFQIKNLLFMGKWTSSDSKELIIVPSVIFSNPGRYGHYILANFLICLFMLMRRKNYTNILSILISIVLLLYSQQRASIYLSLLVVIVTFLDKKNIIFYLRKINNSKKIILVIGFFFILNIGIVKIYNEKFYTQVINKIYNIFEPISNSFDKKMRAGPESLTGRMLMSLNGVEQIFQNYTINTRQILFGSGFGIHSLGTKTILKNIYNEEYQYKKNFFFEQKLVTLLYDVGIAGLLMYFSLFAYLHSIMKKEMQERKVPKIIKKYCFIVTMTPLILLHTGYQFYGDYVFQFFYYLLIGIILNYLINDQKTTP
jgi:hypothetical protein